MDLNEFPSIFQKLEHSHSRHQKTISSPLSIMQFLKILMVSGKNFTRLLELIQLYKQNPLEKIFIFTIYQNYTLALTVLSNSMISFCLFFEEVFYFSEFKFHNYSTSVNLNFITQCEGSPMPLAVWKFSPFDFPFDGTSNLTGISP